MAFDVDRMSAGQSGLCRPSARATERGMEVSGFGEAGPKNGPPPVPAGGAALPPVIVHCSLFTAQYALTSLFSIKLMKARLPME